jgi:hypothetical protein
MHSGGFSKTCKIYTKSTFLQVEAIISNQKDKKKLINFPLKLALPSEGIEL